MITAQPSPGQTAAEGADVIVGMAQIGADGPTGGYFDASGPAAW